MEVQLTTGIHAFLACRAAGKFGAYIYEVVSVFHQKFGPPVEVQRVLYNHIIKIGFLQIIKEKIREMGLYIMLGLETSISIVFLLILLQKQ